MNRGRARLALGGSLAAGVVVAFILGAGSEREVPKAAPPSPPPATSPVPPPSVPPSTSARGVPLSSASVSAPPAVSAAPCPAEMIHVTGKYCPYVAHRCEQWLGPQGEATPRRERRCARYRDELICDGRPFALSFCIDRYEYPNQAGVVPATAISYRDAKRACRAEGKRLCEAEEWSFACEGPRTRPYPYGLERQARACNLDRVPKHPDRGALAQPLAVALEMERLDQRWPSGFGRSCVSPFGVEDMAGNVAEWVHDREGHRGRTPYVTALAGGSWERSRGLCRARDGRHSASHRSHTSGFRCCRDARDGRPTRRWLPSHVRLPRRRRISEP